MKLPTFSAVAALALVSAAPLARAETAADFIAGFQGEARQSDPSFKGFSASRGQAFFTAKHGNEWSCSSCHTDNPLQSGKHAKTGKSIAALAPAANPERFSSAAKVEKWFKRNCNDVLGRACTAQEKGDVLTWLAGLKK
ncbi:MAG TPA: DUF1924 domain-containing protein [Burkholderiales bacterium]|nr:DUF1924 domain-containing protein [Burkholderiales bacterium]